jgi:hypothetical protein
MVKSPVKEKLMRILLDGKPHSELELARSIGFSRAASIQRWIRAFENARFIVRKPVGKNGDYICQLILSRDSARKIYAYAEFRQIRPLIRISPWFSPLFLDTFEALPGELPIMLTKMVQQSHTFFEIIDTYNSPERIQEVYHLCLYVNELWGIKNEEFNAWCLYYHLYVQSIVRDLSEGGLGEEFIDLVGDIQDRIRNILTKNVHMRGITNDTRPLSTQ